MSEIDRDQYFRERFAEQREECSRRFYVRQDEIDIGPFPNNGIAWEWAERNLMRNGCRMVWEDEGSGADHVNWAASVFRILSKPSSR
jgi:hypothetical protein